MASNVSACNPEKLVNFTTQALQKVGVPAEDAAITARKLVATDLRGIESHGVAHLARYVHDIREGRVTPKPQIHVVSQSPAAASVDGDRGLGFVVGHRAMTEALTRAEATGAGFVSVRNSTHYGAGSMYALMALPHDMIGISMTTGGLGMAVPGTTGRGAGINVLSVAAPAQQEPPFVVDMATTVVAAGKVEIARREGKPIPEGWAVDSDGRPITDPKAYFDIKGALLPLGGIPQLGSYKGFALSAAVEMFCSVLSGGLPIPIMGRDPANQGRANHFFGALRVDRFLPLDAFKQGMDELIRTYQGLPKAPGVERVSVAGELEYALEKERGRNGIPLHPAVLATLQELGKDLGIACEL